MCTQTFILLLSAELEQLMPGVPCLTSPSLFSWEQPSSSQSFAVRLCPFRNHLFISAAVIMEIGHSLFGVKLFRPHRAGHLNINSVTGKTRQLFPCFLQFNEELFRADPAALQMNGGDCEKMISY